MKTILMVLLLLVLCYGKVSCENYSSGGVNIRNSSDFTVTTGTTTYISKDRRRKK